MTKKERVNKLLEKQKLLLSSLVLFLEDEGMIIDYKGLYEKLLEASKINSEISEEITD